VKLFWLTTYVCCIVYDDQFFNWFLPYTSVLKVYNEDNILNFHNG